MANFHRLVVALACKDADATLIAYAGMLAKLGGTREVRFVHVAEPGNAPAEALGWIRARVAENFRGTVHPECEVRRGPLTDSLLECVTAFRADLLLLGSKKHKLGARLAMVAPCSVGVIPEGYPAVLSHLMVAVDFSEAAGDTLDWATGLAAADRSIRCSALHVMTHESAEMFADSESDPAQAEAMRSILTRADRHGVAVTPRLVAMTRSGDTGHHGLFLPASIEGADVAHTILAEAEATRADCIAMSTRGRSASAAILLGSVTEKVIERARVPLLAGKHFGASLGIAEILLGRAGSRADLKAS